MDRSARAPYVEQSAALEEAEAMCTTQEIRASPYAFTLFCRDEKLKLKATDPENPLVQTGGDFTGANREHLFKTWCSLDSATKASYLQRSEERMVKQDYDPDGKPLPLPLKPGKRDRAFTKLQKLVNAAAAGGGGSGGGGGGGVAGSEYNEEDGRTTATAIHTTNQRDNNQPTHVPMAARGKQVVSERISGLYQTGLPW